MKPNVLHIVFVFSTQSQMVTVNRLTLLAFTGRDFWRRSFHTWAAADNKCWPWFNASGLMNSNTNWRIVCTDQSLTASGKLQQISRHLPNNQTTL